MKINSWQFEFFPKGKTITQNASRFKFHDFQNNFITESNPLNKHQNVSFKGSSLVRMITGYGKSFNKNKIQNIIEQNLGKGSITEKLDEVLLYSKKVNINNPTDEITKKEVEKVKNHFKSIIDSNEEIEKRTQKFFDKRYNALKNKIKIESDGSISFQEKGWLRLLGEYMIYPIVKMPFELTDYVLRNIRKIPAFKNSKGLKKLYNSNFLESRRLNKKVTTGFDEIKGWFETTDKIISNSKSQNEIKEKFFIASQKMSSPTSSNYSSAIERPLNRIVSGLIPAFFLANDAYNLSKLCGDNDATAKNEHKIRKKQEVSRIMSNAYIQLFTLGAFSKMINASPLFAAITTAITVAFTEIYSRIKNGRSITFISEQKAQELYKKELIKTKTDENKNQKNVETTNSLKNKETNVTTKKSSFKSVVQNEEKPKPLFTPKQAINTILGLAGAGLTIVTLRNNKHIDTLIRKIFKATENKTNKTLIEEKIGGFFNKMTEKTYDKITTKDFEISKSDFHNVIKKLHDNEFYELEKYYKEIAQKNMIKSDDLNKIKLKDNKGNILKISNGAKPIIDFIKEPFNFIFGALKLPFKFVKTIIKLPVISIEKKILNGEKLTKKEAKINSFYENIFGTISKSSGENSITTFVNCMPLMAKKANQLDNAEFKKYISQNILASGNKASMSSYKNSEMALLTRIVATLTTAYFLIADNYNMVMMKSQGQNKEEAKTKAKERAVQETSRLFYATLFQQLFNKTFESTYNSSLMGMSVITGTNVLISEYFTRASIGMPVKKTTKDNILEKEARNEADKGFKGKYFRFMSRLTGKKSLTKRVESQTEDKINTQKSTDKFGSNKNLVELYISKNHSK